MIWNLIFLFDAFHMELVKGSCRDLNHEYNKTKNMKFHEGLKEKTVTTWASSQVHSSMFFLGKKDMNPCIFG